MKQVICIGTGVWNDDADPSRTLDGPEKDEICKVISEETIMSKEFKKEILYYNLHGYKGRFISKAFAPLETVTSQYREVTFSKVVKAVPSPSTS